jgi:hypothetical protein
MDKATELKVRIAGSPLRQADVARHLGMDVTLLSKYLNGIRDLPENFEADFNRAFESAASEASQRLLESARVPA